MHHFATEREVLKQLIQQDIISDFLPVGFNAEGVKKPIGVEIWINLAAESSVEVVFEASVAEGDVFPFVADGSVAAINKAADFAVF